MCLNAASFIASVVFVTLQLRLHHRSVSDLNRWCFYSGLFKDLFITNARYEVRFSSLVFIIVCLRNKMNKYLTSGSERAAAADLGTAQHTWMKMEKLTDFRPHLIFPT